MFKMKEQIMHLQSSAKIVARALLLAGICTFGMLRAPKAIAQNSVAANGAADFISQQVVSISGPEAEAALNQTVAELREVFARFQPALDSQSKIISPPQVSGTEAQPRLRLSMEKCVFVICKTVDIDADITVHENSGSCDRNLTLVADLARSSELLTDTYSALQVSICFKKGTAGAGSITLIAKAMHAAEYSKGIVQQQLFQTLKLQTAPIITAIKESLSSNTQN
jgi:hypothetical protein